MHRWAAVFTVSSVIRLGCTDPFLYDHLNEGADLKMPEATGQCGRQRPSLASHISVPGSSSGRLRVG